MSPLLRRRKRVTGTTEFQNGDKIVGVECVDTYASGDYFNIDRLDGLGNSSLSKESVKKIHTVVVENESFSKLEDTADKENTHTVKFSGAQNIRPLKQNEKICRYSCCEERLSSQKLRKNAAINLEKLSHGTILDNVTKLSIVTSPFRDPLLPAFILLVTCSTILGSAAPVIYHSFLRMKETKSHLTVGPIDIAIIGYFIIVIFREYIWEPFIKQIES